MNELKNKIVYYSKLNVNIFYEDELINCNAKNLVMACEKLTNKIIFFIKTIYIYIFKILTNIYSEILTILIYLISTFFENLK